jgi:DNA-binding NarL/FixJ family response regulator
MQAALRPAVYLVEDSVPLRERLRDLLQLGGLTRIVGEAGTPERAIDGILAAHPDFVVLDYQLDGGTAVDVLAATAAAAPDTVFIVLTNHVDAYTRRICESAGARYFLDKSTEFGRIGEIVAELRAGNDSAGCHGSRR